MDRELLKKVKKEISGITLIALVVTIVVLIILATVSINAVLGEKGIIKTAEKGRIEYSHKSVWEAMEMEYSTYKLEKIEKKEKMKANLIEYLQGKEIIGLEKIDAGYVINTEKLLGEKTSLGNGTDGINDVYKLEEITKETAKTTKLASRTKKIKLADEDEEETKYRVKYYGESGDRELGILGDKIKNVTEEENPNFEITKEVTSEPNNKQYYTEGETIEWTIVARNIGEVQINDIHIADTLTVGEGADKLELNNKITVTKKSEGVSYSNGDFIIESLMPNKEATIVYTYKVTSEAVQKGKAIINTIENITGNPTVVPKEHELPKVEAPLAQYIVVEQTIEMETMIKNSINYFVDEMSYEEYNSIEPRPEYQGIDYPDRPYEEEYDDHAEYEKAYAEYEKAYAEYRRQRDEYYELDDEWWDRYYEWYETSEYGIFMQSFENDDNFKNESIDNLLPIFVSKWGQWNGRDILWKDVFTTQFEILILGFDENNEKVFEESKIIDYSPDICEWKEQKVTFNVYLPENVTKVSVTDDCILKSWIGEIYDNYEYDETLYNRTRMYSIPAECYIYYVDRDAKYVKIPTDEDEWGRLRYWRDFVSGDVYRLEGRWEAMYEGC